MEAVTKLAQAIEAGAGIPAGLFTQDAVLDATVPNWRLRVVGAEDIAAQFGEWYADPGRFEDIVRTPIPGGELVEFLLCWEEDGAPFAAHQAHIIKGDGDRITSITTFCGGRWSASLLAEMGETAHAR